MSLPKSEEFDAELHDWIPVAGIGKTGAWLVLVGRVKGDRKGRFKDGRWIHTSPIASPPETVASGEIVTTRNSRYLLRGTEH